MEAVRVKPAKGYGKRSAKRKPSLPQPQLGFAAKFQDNEKI
jgi:hypothetical protein